MLHLIVIRQILTDLKKILSLLESLLNFLQNSV